MNLFFTKNITDIKITEPLIINIIKNIFKFLVYNKVVDEKYI